MFHLVRISALKEHTYHTVTGQSGSADPFRALPFSGTDLTGQLSDWEQCVMTLCNGTAVHRVTLVGVSGMFSA